MSEYKFIGGNGDTIFFDCYNATIKKTDVSGSICARINNGVRKDLTGGRVPYRSRDKKWKLKD